MSEPVQRPLRTDFRGGFGRTLGGMSRLERRDSPLRQGRPLGPLRRKVGRVGSPRESPGRLRRKSNLEGDTSPWKERAFQVPERVPDATDSFAEQRLEVEGSTRQTSLSPTSNGERGASPSGGVQRQGGIGRGDTVRLRARGTLRRVEIASRGRGLPHPGCSRLAFGPVASPPRAVRSRGAEGEGFEKRDEPQDRLRDATSPRSFAQRKPPRWCETTRTERDAGRVVPSARRGARGNSGFLGVDARWMCRWRGRQVTNPRRGRVLVARSELRLQSVRREGPGSCADASKESGNDPEADEGCLHPDATPRPCPRGPRTGNGRRPRRAQGRTYRPARRGTRGDNRRLALPGAAPQSSKITRLHGSCPDPCPPVLRDRCRGSGAAYPLKPL